MFQEGNSFGKSNIGRKRPDLAERNRLGLSLETRNKISKSNKGNGFVLRSDNPCPYCESTHVISASLSWRCFNCKRTWVKIRKVRKSTRIFRSDISCPKCSSHQIRSMGSRWRCGNCGKEWVKQYKKKEEYNFVRKLCVSKEVIEDMYWKQNMTQFQIAGKLNVSQSAINLFMKQNNISNRGRIEGLRRRTEKTKREAYVKVSKSMKGNINWRFSHQYPNSEEKKMIRFFEKWSLPFKYVGDGSFKVDGKCPDFILEEKKIIIEFFGELWHNETDEPIRIKFFEDRGWKCLIVWGREVGAYLKGKTQNYSWELKLYDKVIRWMANLPPIS